MKGLLRFRFVPLIALLGALVAVPGMAQTAEDKTTVVGLNLLGPVVGLYSGSFEQAIDDDLSVFVIPTYFNAKAGIFDPLASVSVEHIVRADYDLWSISVAVGANYFVNGTAPTGVFAGGWLQPGYGSFRFDSSALEKGDAKQVDDGTVILSAGVHVGYRLIWDLVAITPRVGVSYQLALNEASGFDQRMKNLVGSVRTGLRFPWGIEVGIAF
jgi:hypothetical protein